MKKTAFVVLLIFICGFIFADDPKVEDYRGWYIFSFSKIENILVADGTNIMTTGYMVIIRHTADKVTRQYTLISPEMAKSLIESGMDLKIFEGL